MFTSVSQYPQYWGSTFDKALYMNYKAYIRYTLYMNEIQCNGNIDELC